MTRESDKLFVADIREGQPVRSSFLLEGVHLNHTKSGRPYASLRLRDRTGRIEARVWEGADRFCAAFSDGDLAKVQGVAEAFGGQVQVKIAQASKLEPEEADLTLFLPASPYDPEVMFAELTGRIESLRDPHLKGLLEDVFGDPALAERFKRAPAAKRFHHAYVSGQLEHTLAVARAAEALVQLYPALNRDLLLAGALLHDVGKIEEFDGAGGGDYTTSGRLLGHIVLGLGIVEAKLAGRPDFPQALARLVIHLLVSHHGEYEFGSPKKPKILEALALYYLDEMDAKLNGIGGFIERHASGETGWTDYNRLMERFFYRPEPRSEPPADEARPEPAPVEAGAEDTEPEPAEEKDPNQLRLLQD